MWSRRRSCQAWLPLFPGFASVRPPYETPLLTRPKGCATILVLLRRSSTYQLDYLVFCAVSSVCGILGLVLFHLPPSRMFLHGFTILSSALSMIVLLSTPIGHLEPSTEQTLRETSRAPEDGLRLYQFLTVSWMGNLIAKGRVQRLVASDVWALPHQFQHARLYENFQLLTGGVLRRVITANAVDCCILSVIALCELACGQYTIIYYTEGLG